MLFLDSITEYPKFTLVLYVLGEMKKNGHHQNQNKTSLLKTFYNYSFNETFIEISHSLEVQQFDLFPLTMCFHFFFLEKEMDLSVLI